MRPVPAPRTCTIDAISAFFSVSPSDAFCTFRILPRSGSSAWYSDTRAMRADPSALSPSTRNSSLRETPVVRQSTSFGGIAAPSRAVLRRAASFCCFWVSRTREASTTFCSTTLASDFVLRSSVQALTCLSTMPWMTRVMPAVDSSSFVCDVNCGSGSRTCTTAVMPSRTSSIVGMSSLGLSSPRVLEIASCNAFAIARSKPRRCVPPWTLRIVLVKHSTVRS